MEIYTPLKSIDVIVETIERKVNEDWNFLETNRKSAEELLSFIYSLKLVTKELLINRKEQVNNLFYSKKKDPSGSYSLIRTALSGDFYYVVCLCVCCVFS